MAPPCNLTKQAVAGLFTGEQNEASPQTAETRTLGRNFVGKSKLFLERRDAALAGPSGSGSATRLLQAALTRFDEAFAFRDTILW